MSIPADLSYTSEHEWVAVDNDGTARCGITRFAADALGEVVFLDLPKVGAAVTRGESCGEIESTKSVSELYAPVTGTIAAINGDAVAAPEQVNADPYGTWLLTITPTGPLDGLLDAAAYAKLTAEQED